MNHFLGFLPRGNVVIQTWIVDACKAINNSKIENSIMAVGFNDPCKWHTYNHDVYGERFWAAREITGEMEASLENFEQYPQENDTEDISDE